MRLAWHYRATLDKYGCSNLWPILPLLINKNYFATILPRVIHLVSSAEI